MVSLEICCCVLVYFFPTGLGSWDGRDGRSWIWASFAEKGECFFSSACGAFGSRVLVQRHGKFMLLDRIIWFLLGSLTKWGFQRERTGLVVSLGWVELESL